MQENINIRPHTTFGVGGTVRYFIEVERAKDAIEAIKFADEKKIPYVIIAGGSNLVFSDGLLNMLVIKIKTPTKLDDSVWIRGNRVVCDAGVDLMELINAVMPKGLAGLEALSGIPGSVGGAIVGNAGAYGQNISGPLKWVDIFDGKEIRKISKEECQFSYRDSILKKKSWIVVSARFVLMRDVPETLQKKSAEIIKTRNERYIPGIKCPGSFFKNILIENMPKESLGYVLPEHEKYGKVPAGYLLELVGAKGMVEGGIKIADFHGNLLMNTGGATYKDVVNLVTKLKKLVRDKFGVELEEEVRYITG